VRLWRSSHKRKGSQPTPARVGRFPSAGSYACISDDVSTYTKNFPALFWRWLEALWLVNRAGFDFLFEDLCARVAHLRERDAPPPTLGWYEQLARCEREHSEAIQAAILCHDERAIRAEIADEIRELRVLLAMLDRPAHDCVRQTAA
jgi:hypothetical protein